MFKVLFLCLSIVTACTDPDLSTEQLESEINAGQNWCGEIGACEIGHPQAYLVCRGICQDPGIPWFKSTCGGWTLGSGRQVGRCLMTP